MFLRFTSRALQNPSIKTHIPSQEKSVPVALTVEQLAELQSFRECVARETKRTAAELGGDATDISNSRNLTVLEWNGTRYVVRPDCVDQLTFHMYFALLVAQEYQTERYLTLRLTV